MAYAVAVKSMRATDQYFESDGNRLRFRDAGRGMALVFIHGWTLDLDAWEPQAVELSRAFRVIRYDRRGFGLSSGRPSICDDTIDLQSLLDRLALAQAAVVGMSQGARVALSAALTAPHRISSLILDGPPNFRVASESGADEDLPLPYYRNLVRTAGIDAFRSEWQNHPFVRLRTEDPDARALLARMIARYPGRDLADPPPNTGPPLDARSLAALRNPVLIINGEYDTDSRKAAGEAFCRMVPRAQRTLVAHAGHLANLDNPHAYNEAIRGFLQRQAGAAA
jgi:3-oxoadipate enol-lactonase